MYKPEPETLEELKQLLESFLSEDRKRQVFNMNKEIAIRYMTDPFMYAFVEMIANNYRVILNVINREIESRKLNEG